MLFRAGGLGGFSLTWSVALINENRDIHVPHVSTSGRVDITEH